MQRQREKLCVCVTEYLAYFIHVRHELLIESGDDTCDSEHINQHINKNRIDARINVFIDDALITEERVVTMVLYHIGCPKRHGVEATKQRTEVCRRWMLSPSWYEWCHSIHTAV